ncbi:unnamed protein product [Brassica rapa]|uniref:Uncharacterized protein n=1 Tax=Brassica campestris TaxID=3711 RepID=A0A8D9GVF3_BRACM|nr:unnamed protein product [Brassica rapa]
MSLIRSKLEDHRCIRFDMILSPWLQKYAKQLFNFADTYIVLEAHKSYNSTWYGNKPLWAASKSRN